MDKIIKLPQPQKELEFPLMKALENRRTTRKWKGTHLSAQKISDLLWMGLVFVADLSSMNSPFLKNKEAQRFCAWVDTGFISQNVYLFGAASNLGTAVLFRVDRDNYLNE